MVKDVEVIANHFSHGNTFVVLEHLGVLGGVSAYYSSAGKSISVKAVLEIILN
jgi:hypothetical protein